MFYANKFTIAKDAAIKLLSIVEDDDYVSFVTFAGEIKVKPAKRAGDYKEELISYINGLETSHGTDVALGLEEALAAVKTLNRAHNQVVVISDGFSFDSVRKATEVAADLAAEGATLTAINTYISHQGEDGVRFLREMLAAADAEKNYYQISTPEQVSGLIFGDMAENIADVVITKDSKVNIAKPNDSSLAGISSLPSVSKYVLSVSKYDATVPLTVTYLKGNNYQETVPLYAYRAHGNGIVASFSTSISDEWCKNFSSEEKTKLLYNVLVACTPKERIDRPFTVVVTEGAKDATVELHPSTLDPAAKATVRVTYPNGRVADRALSSDGAKYFALLETATPGIYRLTLTYKSGESSYSYDTIVEVAYLPEYDMFVGCNRYNVSRFMRDNGSVKVGEIPDVSVSESEVTTYRQSYIVPLLIAAVALFLADVAIRKIKRGKKVKETGKERA